MENEILENTIEILTEQMIKNNFQNRGVKGDKYIISKQDLYKFSIKLIKVVKEVENE